jgi:glycosyltransferase involved in cell wall biosynthesis
MGGIPEQIRAGLDGVLFNPDDSQDLADKLKDCLADRPRLRQWGLAGRERMASEHDPGRHAAQMADVLAGLGKPLKP